MLCQYCSTVMPMEGIGIEIEIEIEGKREKGRERERERLQNPQGVKSPR